ncbi:hypothetical protein [Pontibacter virosus]|uniref:Uncharacterized protein n=1 Tax=Pontibacter virosus TaxID=1765052 RepID=A0A2U1B3K2_9BACT|nr:hypothetical protein [Pontibacter virosus]PVY43259.1 hypothetical protein C8E01_102438 [Pontibacter virosus]
MNHNEIENTIDAYIDEHHARYKQNAEYLRCVSEGCAKLAVGLIHEHDLPEIVEHTLIEMSAGYKNAHEAFQDFTLHSEQLLVNIFTSLEKQRIERELDCPPFINLENVSFSQFLGAKIKHFFRRKQK